MENENKNGFSYTYSAAQQEELRRIRDKYDHKRNENEDKMAKLRRLDASVTQTAQTIALIFGVVGALILGFGMSLCMTELSEMLGVYKSFAMAIGIVVGVFGGVMAGMAYPVYNLVIRARKKRVAPEIIRLTDELMK